MRSLLQIAAAVAVLGFMTLALGEEAAGLPADGGNATVPADSAKKAKRGAPGEDAAPSSTPATAKKAKRGAPGEDAAPSSSPATAKKAKRGAPGEDAAPSSTPAKAEQPSDEEKMGSGQASE